MLAEALLACTDLDSLVVDAVHSLIQETGAAAKAATSGTALAHVLIGALEFAADAKNTATRTNAPQSSRCVYKGKSANGAEQTAVLMTESLLRLSGNTATDASGANNPCAVGNSGSQGALVCAELRLLSKLLTAVRCLSSDNWNAAAAKSPVFQTCRIHAHEVLVHRVAYLRLHGPGSDNITGQEYSMDKKAVSEMGRGLAAVVAVLISLESSMHTAAVDSGSHTVNTVDSQSAASMWLPTDSGSGVSVSVSVSSVSSSSVSIAEVISWLVKCGEGRAASTLADAADKRHGAEANIEGTRTPHMHRSYRELLDLLHATKQRKKRTVVTATSRTCNDLTVAQNFPESGTSSPVATAWVQAAGSCARHLCLPGVAQQSLPLFELHSSVEVHYSTDLTTLRAALMRLTSYLKTGGVIVGIDCEWRPYCKSATVEPVALCQVCLPSSVELIDLLVLMHRTDQENGPEFKDGGESEMLLQEYFDLLRYSAVVVGFGLAGDFRRLFDSYPNLFLDRSTSLYNHDAANDSGSVLCSRSIDLVDIFSVVVLPIAHFQQQEQQRSAAEAASPHILSRTSIGLDKLSRLMLARQLAKEEQTSDWGARPLSVEQRLYSANDAAVLLPLLASMITFAVVGLTTESCQEAFTIDSYVGRESGSGGACALQATLGSTSLIASMAPWTKQLCIRVSKNLQESMELVGSVAPSITAYTGARLALGPDAVVAAMNAAFGYCPPLIDLATAAVTSEGGTAAAGTAAAGTAAAAAAAAAVAAAAGQVDAALVKTLVLLCKRHEQEPRLVACVLAVDRRLSLTACAQLLGVQRRHDLHLVNPDELVSMCGFERGAIGPIGWRTAAGGRYDILVDTALDGARQLLCGAGRENLVVPVEAAELVAKMGARIAPISTAATAPTGTISATSKSESS